MSHGPLVATLRRLLHPAIAPSSQRCELCAGALHDSHGHVVDTKTRRLLCACATCGAFDSRPDLQSPGSTAASGRYRVVPHRYAHLPSMTISPAQWQALGVPVGLAFFFFNSTAGRIIAFYPGAAGPAESLVPPDAWSALAQANPWLEDIQPDVEALLVRKTPDNFSWFIVPIDACYELAGRIRAHWSGLSGGERVADEIKRFFAVILEQSERRRVLPVRGAHQASSEVT